MKVKREIKTIGGSVLFSLEKEDNTMRQTLEQAVKEGADLRCADLRGAYLEGAYLEGADLRGAYLEGTNLGGTNLEGADLRGAYLEGTNLGGTNLEGADLRGADLRGAYLEGAYLEGANLEGANLRGADLRGANEKTLPESYINQCSRDMLYVFEHARNELPYLREKLVSGHVNGTQYEGECACLLGSLGKGNITCVRKVVKAIPYYDMGLHNFSEQWFYNIKSGDTPETNFFAKHALKLIDEVLKA
jgi:hypothetical protein